MSPQRLTIPWETQSVFLGLLHKTFRADKWWSSTTNHPEPALVRSVESSIRRPWEAIAEAPTSGAPFYTEFIAVLQWTALSGRFPARSTRCRISASFCSDSGMPARTERLLVPLARKLKRAPPGRLLKDGTWDEPLKIGPFLVRFRQRQRC